MREIRISLKDVAELMQLQKTEKWESLAVFSANSYESSWAGTTYGHTPIEVREELTDVSPVLNQIKHLFLGQREQGGRFFIKLDGAYFKNKEKQEIQFVKFSIIELEPIARK